MNGTPENSPRPKCSSCGRETSRTGSRYGKGIYQCTNASCPEAFKTVHRRPSAIV